MAAEICAESSAIRSPSFSSSSISARASARRRETLAFLVHEFVDDHLTPSYGHCKPMIFKLIAALLRADRRLSKGSGRLTVRSGPGAPPAGQGMPSQRGLEKTGAEVRKSLSRGSATSRVTDSRRFSPIVRAWAPRAVAA